MSKNTFQLFKFDEISIFIRELDKAIMNNDIQDLTIRIYFNVFSVFDLIILIQHV